MIQRTHRQTIVGALAVLATVASAQSLPGGGSLSNLMTPRGGKIAHYSSHDLSGGNGDMRRVLPGQTYTLVDHKGAGIVRRWWITLAPRNNREIQRQGIIRCYWDGETEPSVEVPASDFFGVGFGEWIDFQSLPLNMTSGGYNCYWPMPFRKSARITFENRSKVPVDALYYNIDVETHKSLPKDTLLFHAQFRRTDPTVAGKPVTLLEATGKGQYVGTLLSMQTHRGRSLGFLEGDERVFVDGETTPSIIGTGTEDYFSSGWYYDTGTYSAPYHGVTIKDTKLGRVSTYRWHIEDPIPFEKSLLFQIEHGGRNDAPDVDYTSVAFWYQTHPHTKFPPLPADLMPIQPEPLPRIEGMIEGEALVGAAKATSGSVTVQDLTWVGGYSGLEQLWWQPEKAGERLTLTLDAPEEKEYALVGYFTRAPDYARIRLRANGQDLPVEMNGYDPRVVHSGPVRLGRVRLKKGANEIVIETTGKDDRATNYFVGIDGFRLEP